MDNCLFCKILRGDIPATKIYEDAHVIAIDDIEPQAPQHKLILPRKHIETLNDLQEEDTLLVGQMVQTARLIADQLGVSEEGYRLVMNCNRGGGQAVFHIHLHLLAGRPMQWPPG
jgi:histidine triad (HIT) family protein